MLRHGGVVLLLACHAPRPLVLEPDPAVRFEASAAEALRRVPDATRGGPPLAPFSSPLPPFSGVSRATGRYVGVEVCSTCHVEEASAWRDSAHARAWAALEGASATRRADCVGCHATGYLHPGGYGQPVSASPPLTDVGCEACHGPGSDHVVGVNSGAPPAQYGVLPRSDAACVACHTWERSPEFRWATGWPSIAHGP